MTTAGGLPAHILLVHAVIVLVPLTALVRAHTEIGDYVLPWAVALAVVAIAFVVRALLARRAARATVAAGGGPGTARATSDRQPGTRSDAALPGGRVTSIVLAVLAVVVAVGSVATVYRVGESGSRAVWTGQFSAQAQPPPFGPGGPPPGG